MAGPFRAAHARAGHWGHAAKACVDGLGPFDGRDSLGVVYVTAAFGEHLASILTYLRETTKVADWVGAVGHGILSTGIESHEGGAVAVLVGALPRDSWHLFQGVRDQAAFADRHGGWIHRHRPVLAVIHADPLAEDLAGQLAVVAGASGGFLAGGLSAAGNGAGQIAGRPVEGGVSGVLLGREVPVATGLTQGCSPMGASHAVTAAAGQVVMELDGRPALAVLKEEIGEIMARDLRRVAGYIHTAQPVAGSDTGDFLVRNLAGIDPERGWLAVAGRFAAGDRLLFVRRDANYAQKDMRRMLAQLKRRVDAAGGIIRGGLYVGCVGRGAAMFGAEGREVGLIHQVLGPFPLAGFFAGGEIHHDRLYAYTGVLTLFLGDAP